MRASHGFTGDVEQDRVPQTIGQANTGDTGGAVHGSLHRARLVHQDMRPFVEDDFQCGKPAVLTG